MTICTSRTSSRSAFTLVELLVVIGIIALLVAMLLPALNRARQQADLVRCMSNLRQMGLALNIYAQTYRDYPYYNYPGAPQPKDRLWPGDWVSGGWPVMNTWWAGQVGRLEFLPTLRASKALGAYEVGFCPTAWPERTFSFKADPTGGLDQCVMEPGRPGWLLKYAWYPMWSRGNNVDNAHQSAGEYLYLGPGTNGAYWNWEGVSPRLSREFGTLIGGADSINKWTGVHYGGRVTHERNLVHVRNQWSRKRVPLMGESAQSVVGGNPTEMAAFNAAPHMPKWRLRNDWSKNGGNLNYLFNDGSVETYPYSF